MKKNNSEYIPGFDKSFRRSCYWGAQPGIATTVGIALTPPKFCDPIPARLGRFAGRLGRGSRRRVLTSSSFYFPERNEAECEATVDETFTITPRAMVMMAELAIRGPEKIQPRVDWQRLEIIEEIRCNNERVIFLVPHGWVVDIPATLVASQGQKMAAMFHNQGNPIFNYAWSTVRCRFGDHLHARNDGIKPLVQSVRQGYWGCYSPDQDHGLEHNEFVDFFVTYKVTLPTIGRLTGVCRARVVLLFPTYDGKTYRLTIQVRLPMNDLLEVDDHTIAWQMGEKIEILVGPQPGQYTWILKLLKTYKPGEIQPYKRKGLYSIE